MHLIYGNIIKILTVRQKREKEDESKGLSSKLKGIVSRSRSIILNISFFYILKSYKTHNIDKKRGLDIP